MLELFREGKLSLDRVLRAAQDLQRMFPDSETGLLADILAKEFQRGGLR